MTEELIYSDLTVYAAVDGDVELCMVQAENEQEARAKLIQAMSGSPRKEALKSRWVKSGSKLLTAIPVAI